MGDEIRIRASVGKWGNTAAVRIPATLLAQANLEEQQAIDLVLSDGRIVIEPTPDPKVRLADMLARITPTNLHNEVDFGQPVGKEAF